MPPRTQPAVTVDVAAFAMDGDDLQVLLVQRRFEPFEGSWALPGGFVEADERLDQAAARELREETGVRVDVLEQLAAYGDPGRDPRRSTVTVAHVAVLREMVQPVAADDAASAEWVPVGRILGKGRGRLPLAFDHTRIVGDAVGLLRDRIEDGRMAAAFLPPSFTLAALRGVYEAVWGVALDPANFRRKVLAADGFLVETGTIAPSGPEGGKPARLYRRGKAGRLDPPMRRPA
jgi:8-oxo-dGTP diphosphatase